MSDKPTASIVRGCGALTAMLELIGDPDAGGDKSAAKLLCDNEADLRNMLQWTLQIISEEV